MKRKLLHWLQSVSPRERMIILVAGAFGLAYAIYYPLSAVDTHITEQERAITVRSRELGELTHVLKRYDTLTKRLQKLKAIFAEAEMSFEQVTEKLDKIIKEGIGSDNYELKKKGGAPAEFGFEYEKQDFSVRVREVNIDQLVKLLYQLEQGESPLFLSKVDIQLTPVAGKFSSTMELFSIRKHREQST